jgi:hypothetical protein
MTITDQLNDLQERVEKLEKRESLSTRNRFWDGYFDGLGRAILDIFAAAAIVGVIGISSLAVVFGIYAINYYWFGQ